MKATIYEFRRWTIELEWETREELYQQIFETLSSMWIDISFED